ncbi:MAG: manB [Candidatus Saganbacteria bacterium]|uniref:ManB n=1 Tax=Candidatus Saganbacteria bacterium TaxID=2575572 RepID=A0A833L1K3_UNCSA|nr:MAG: manB [Candidatus Saganbacteria bacterium]
MLKISISGVRGIYGDSLTPEICLDFAKAAGTYFDGGVLAVGSDTRESSEFIKGIVIHGLVSCGSNILDLGIVPTPTIGIAIRENKLSGGIMITASHNPKEWNGLKFFRSDGIFLNSQEAEKLIQIYESKGFIEKPNGETKTYDAASELHIKKILAAVHCSKIKSRKFKVVIDSVNGAGSIITPKLLEKLGCQVIKINTDIKKPFPRGAEPTPENLSQLCETVLKEKADIGFAQDPDADRLAIVTEEGIAISEEYTLTLCVKHVLSSSLKSRKLIVANLSTTRAIDEVAKEFGGIVIRTKVGEVYVAEEIKNEKADIGGEGNGGVIYPKVGFNRDSLCGIALILDYMARQKSPVSKIVNALPQYYFSKKKMECANVKEGEDLIERIKERYRGETMDFTEGIKVIFKDSWVHVRPSNTEPIIRIIAEAKSPNEANELAENILNS